MKSAVPSWLIMLAAGSTANSCALMSAATAVVSAAVASRTDVMMILPL
ncbi:MAG: hypothetical protein F2569_04640 [Actinobacteria bacterium]|nr:hypothetical protein [Actinomycetota bacterium]